MRIIVLLLAALLSPLAHADFFTARLAYQKGDYGAAARDYRSMAELGNAIAQYDLAALYLNGQGVQQSELNAYAWASLAAASGHAAAQALADKLRPGLAPGSEQIARDLVAPYDRAALEAAIMPKIQDDREELAHCKPVLFPEFEFPDEAKHKGISGKVFIEFTVAPDGSARNPRIIYAVPNDVFDAAARTMLLRTHFSAQPAAAHCELMFRFEVSGTSYPDLQPFAEKTLKNANDGDMNAQFLYGLMLAGLPQLGKSYKDALPWFLKAAQNGQSAAQYQMGSSLLFGMGCQCEVTKGEVWLKRAADAGQADAQVTLGAYALRGEPSAADMKIAKLWLERAVATGDRDGMYYLAALLAAAPDAQIRDPARAQHLLEQLKRGEEVNPSILEIRAAAQAASGDFAAAAHTERGAIVQARRHQWDLTPLNERLARYESKQPWYGNLLVL